MLFNSKLGYVKLAFFKVKSEVLVIQLAKCTSVRVTGLYIPLLKDIYIL